MRRYADTVAALGAAGLPVRELRGAGCAAVTLAAGRLVALAFEDGDVNLLWTHPDLDDSATVRDRPETLTGGIGGDRLWFSPELRYHWRGAPDWDGFGNYHVPVEADPGGYAFTSSVDGAIAMAMSANLPTNDGTPPLEIAVEREFRAAPMPLSAADPLMTGISYVGVETRNRLTLAPDARAGTIDLWHLMQVPVGSIAIMPVRTPAAPVLCYGRAGDWELHGDHVAWRYGGTANAKLGLGADDVTGRTGLIRDLGAGRRALIVRDHQLGRAGDYADHPYGDPRRDQVVQAWDGFGFGELEYHSVALDAAAGPRELTGTDRIWAFGGEPAALASIAHALLGVDIGMHLDMGSEAR